MSSSMVPSERSFICNSDTDDDGDYDQESDAIDSDVEANLYGLIHYDVVDGADGDKSHGHSIICSRSTSQGTSPDEKISQSIVLVKEASSLNPDDVINLEIESSSSTINLIDSSDSDSNSVHLNIETKLSELIDSELELHKKISHLPSSRKFQTRPFQGNHDPSLWALDQKDLMSRFQRNRYIRASTWCGHCNKKTDHPTRLCDFIKKTIVCYLCGAPGHGAHRCKSRLCYKCHENHSEFGHCSTKTQDSVCLLCGGMGHSDQICPNHWRKYHVTTDPNAEIGSQRVGRYANRNERQSCANCGHNKHYTFNCHHLPDLYIQSSPFLELSKNMQSIIKKYSKETSSKDSKRKNVITKFESEDENGNKKKKMMLNALTEMRGMKDDEQPIESQVITSKQKKNGAKKAKKMNVVEKTDLKPSKTAAELQKQIEKRKRRKVQKKEQMRVRKLERKKEKQLAKDDRKAQRANNKWMRKMGYFPDEKVHVKVETNDGQKNPNNFKMDTVGLNRKRVRSRRKPKNKQTNLESL